MATMTTGMIIIVVFTLLPDPVRSQCRCHDTWVTYNGSCYLFGQGKGSHFTEAEHYCRQHNSHIVQIDSEEENNFLKDYIMHLVGERYWIGLTDEEVEGLWKWAGTEKKMTFTDWNPGEPNSWNELEDCVGIAKDDGGRWFDIGCDRKFLPICEARGDGTEPSLIFG